MTSKITESAIEKLAIERLESLGYRYLHGGVIAHDGDAPERTGYGDVILEGCLRDAVARINPYLPANLHDSAIKDALRVRSPELLVDALENGSSGIKNLAYRTLLNEFEYALTSQAKTKEISIKMSPFFGRFFENELQICTLDKLRDTLLPKLMSGEVMVAI